MIADPINDNKCLGAITDLARSLVANKDPALVAFASNFATTEALYDAIRDMPQEDDTGDPNDGPKVEACDPPQRLRIMPKRPNCFERTFTAVAGAEMIDPGPVRQMATVDTPNGRHTLPVEDGEPVVLDPRQHRNALSAALFRATQARNGNEPVSLTPEQAVDWIAGVTTEPAQNFRYGVQRARNGHRALRGVLTGRAIRVAELRDVAFVLALADREAPLYGPIGKRIVHATALAISRLDLVAAQCETDPAAHRNGLELKVGKYSIRPDTRVWKALGRVGGRLGYHAGVAALREKVAALGVSPPMLASFEHELNREGLTLGPLAKPAPMAGTLAAVTPEAIAGRWLASKIPL